MSQRCLSALAIGPPSKQSWPIPPIGAQPSPGKITVQGGAKPSEVRKRTERYLDGDLRRGPGRPSDGPTPPP
jgi:hypothetical protein